MSFTFNDAIPQAAGSPSVDQQTLLNNNVAIQGIMTIDHNGYNVSNGGTHTQIHLPAYTSPTVINGTAAQGSVVYSAAGTADTSHAQCFFLNPIGTFPMSLIRAYARVNGGGTILNGFNIASVVSSGSGLYTVNLSANVCTGTNYGVLLGTELTGVAQGRGGVYGINSSTQIAVAFYNFSGVGANPNFFTIVVFQL